MSRMDGQNAGFSESAATGTFLRLDGGNSPTNDISWNQKSLLDVNAIFVQYLRANTSLSAFITAVEEIFLNQGAYLAGEAIFFGASPDPSLYDGYIGNFDARDFFFYNPVGKFIYQTPLHALSDLFSESYADMQELVVHDQATFDTTTTVNGAFNSNFDATFTDDVIISRAIPLITLTSSGGDDYLIDVGSTASFFRIRNTTDARSDLVINGTGNIAISTNYSPSTTYKLLVQDRNSDASPAFQYAALSSSFEYLPGATTTTMGTNVHGYQGGVTVFATSGSISGGGAFLGLRGDATVFLGNTFTQSNGATGLFASYAANMLSGGTGTASSGNCISTFISIATGVTQTVAAHIRIGSGGSSGTLTTIYGLFVPQITYGTNNFEVWLDVDASIWFRETGCFIGSSAGATLDVTSTTTLNLKIGSTSEVVITATQIDLCSATTDRVNFIGGDGASAPSTSLGAAIVNFYGASATNFLGDPVEWLDVKINGTARKIPCY